MDFKDYTFKFDMPKDTYFECRKCGECCFDHPKEYILLTYPEINRINDFLNKNINTEKFDDFINSNFAFKGRADCVGDQKLIKQNEKLMYNFYLPQMFVKEKGAMYALTLVLKRMKDGMCLFFDPLKNSCFIYQVRPHVCRLFPFTTSISRKDKFILIEVANKKCISQTSDHIKLRKFRTYLKIWTKEHAKDYIIHTDALNDSLKRRGIIKPNLLDVRGRDYIEERTMEEIDETIKKIKEESNQHIDEKIIVEQKKFINVFHEDGLIKQPSLEFS